MIVETDKQCNRCGAKIRQNVFFKEESRRIEIRLWQRRCPFCKAFIKKPTVGEIRKVIISNEMQDSA